MQHNQWLSDAAVCGVGRLELDGLAQVIELIGRIEITQLLCNYLCRTNRSAAEQLGAAGGASDLDFSTPPPSFRGAGAAPARAPAGVHPLPPSVLYVGSMVLSERYGAGGTGTLRGVNAGVKVHHWPA